MILNDTRVIQQYYNIVIQPYTDTPFSASLSLPPLLPAPFLVPSICDLFNSVFYKPFFP